ncbi:hypothetical protein BaRGS_00015098 [Batillaria attramentaria]|uniref:Uncharacterized protein n=1 Tax=Batillaria attramentaria TaxID=370345 RepID=A0ABD0L252_9CAEN
MPKAAIRLIRSRYGSPRASMFTLKHKHCNKIYSFAYYCCFPSPAGQRSSESRSCKTVTVQNTNRWKLLFMGLSDKGAAGVVVCTWFYRLYTVRTLCTCVTVLLPRIQTGDGHTASVHNISSFPYAETIVVYWHGSGAPASALGEVGVLPASTISAWSRLTDCIHEPCCRLHTIGTYYAILCYTSLNMPLVRHSVKSSMKEQVTMSLRQKPLHCRLFVTAYNVVHNDCETLHTSNISSSATLKIYS